MVPMFSSPLPPVHLRCWPELEPPKGLTSYVYVRQELLFIKRKDKWWVLHPSESRHNGVKLLSEEISRLNYQPRTMKGNNFKKNTKKSSWLIRLWKVLWKNLPLILMSQQKKEWCEAETRECSEIVEIKYKKWKQIK